MYIFRVRPFVRLFTVVVLFWLCVTFAEAAVIAPPGQAIVLTLLAIAAGLLAFVALRGLLRLLGAYGRTWIG